MQIIYILVAFKWADYKVKKYFEKGVKKRCEITKKRCEIVNIEEFSKKTPMQIIYILVAF